MQQDAGRCLELRHRHNIFRVAATAQRLSPERREAGNGLDHVYEFCKLLSRHCPIIQKRPMAKDHYVAQTYLKHWCDPKNKPPLQVYSKSDLKHFPCRPRDVCHEWDGDLIPEYLTDPARLGKFRKIFEPRWKPTVERLSAGNIDPIDKLVLSMAWAHFFLCPPAQREIAKGIHANEVRAMARSLFEGHRLDPATLNIEIEREADFFKRFGTKHRNVGFLQPRLDNPAQ
jgi:hypothetical protein